MADQPILKLFTELGLDADDTIYLNHYGDTTPWTPMKVKLAYADVLAGILTGDQQNVYVSVNPVEGVIEGRGDASQVSRLLAVWADLDYKDTGLANEAAARTIIDSISAVVHSNPVAIVHSGHGLQPYWAVDDGHITAGNRGWHAALLRRFGHLVQRFAAIEGGKVDSVFDLPRVLRAPGTVNWKIAGSPLPTSLEIVEWSHPLSVQELDEVLTQYGFTDDGNYDTDLVVVSPPEAWEPAVRDCAWSQGLATEIAGAEPKARHPWLTGLATKIEVAARNGCITNDTYVELVKLLDAKFASLLANGDTPRKASPGEVNTAFRWARQLVSTFTDIRMADNLNYHSHRANLYAVPDLPKSLPTAAGASVTEFPTQGGLALVPDLTPIALGDENFSFTDATNGERLAKAALGKYIYAPGLDWLVWDGGRFRKDEENSIIRLAVQTSKDFASENTDKKSIAWAQDSMSGARLNTAVKLAATVPEIVCMPMMLDSEPMELCTPGGIVDLATAKLRSANPVLDRHTRQTKYTPKEGEHPQFDAFLKRVLVDDDLIDYVQVLFGLSLIGETREHILPIFSGAGANGKSTLMEIMGGCIGDYYAIMPENFLLETGRQEHSTEIFRLRGVRLANASESRPDGKFNESRVKMLTGEPILTGRAMRADFVDFKATHTLMVNLNHPPAISSGGDSLWRRIRKLDFKVQIPKEERDLLFSQKLLAAEGPQILQWMLEGCLRFLEEGLVDPVAVQLSTNDYRAEEDHVKVWMDECTVVDTNHGGFTSMEIYGSYLEWCTRNRESALPNVALFRDLRNRITLTPTRVGRQRGWRGLYVFVDGSRPAMDGS